MKKLINFRTLAVLLIFLLGFFLRLHHYDVYPQRGATHDEFAFAFLGINFLKTGAPSSWSNIPLYQNKYYLKANDTRYSIVTPYFDHPPLFGLLTGGVALLRGETELEEVNLSTIRLIPVILGSLSIVLLFKLCQNLYGFRVAAISALVFATVPTYVVASRMSLAENLLIPELLLALILFERFIRKREKKLVYLLGLIAGLAFLTKFIGIFIYLSLLLLFLLKPKLRKEIIPFSLTAFLIGSFYFLYGLVINRELFLEILAFQGAREVGPFSFFNLFLAPAIVNKIFVDGWVYFGWAALAVLLYKDRKHFEITAAFFSYLFLFVLTVDQRDLHGWYNYPFYPFLAMASGKLIEEITKTPSLLNIVFLLTAGLSTVSLTYFSVFGLSSSLFRLLVVISFLPFFITLFRIKKLDFLVKSVFIFYLVLIFFLNIVAVLHYVHPA